MSVKAVSLNYDVTIGGKPSDYMDRFGEQTVKAIMEVTQNVADAIVERAQQLAPVRTGELRDSIHTEIIDPLTIAVVADAPYAVYQEMGTHNMSAHPFLTPAFEAYKAEFTTQLVNTLKDALRKK